MPTENAEVLSSHSGTYTLGPDNAALTVKTGKTGPAAMAGHNLKINVSSWSATLTLADDAASTLTLTVDTHSLRTISGDGGAQALGVDDLPKIDKTIDQDVLKGRPISFESTHIHAGDAGDELHVHGDLNLLGNSGPIEFSLKLDDSGHLTANATVVQSSFGVKPYSILFGTLKLADEVQVMVDGKLPTPA